MSFIYYLFLFCVIFCRVPSVNAAVSPFSDENIHINADRMNQNLVDGVYTAEGNVVVFWKGQNLTADKVRYVTSTHMMYADGSVVLTKDSAVLKGETLVMNTDTGRAEIDPAYLNTPNSGMSVTAEKLIRINENEYTGSSAEITSCDLPDPSWKFGTDNLKVDLLGYASGRDVIFYVNNIPVLYLPWIAFPVVMERRSGVLFPKFGYSKTRGFQLDIPIYLVISPSQDLQLDLDIMSRRGVGTGLEYRYIRTRGSEGHITAYPIYDQPENRWRGQLAQEHKEIFSIDANLRMTVNAVSDRTFLSDFGEKSGDYNRQSTDTVINMLKTWQNFAATSYIHYSQDLYATNNQTTVQTLPSLGVAAVRQTVFSAPLYFDLDGTADNIYIESGPSGQRLHLLPRVTLLPFQNRYFQTSLFAAAHVRSYATEKRDSSTDIQTRDGDLLPTAGARLSTSLARIYDTDFFLLKKIRHEIIPEIGYNYTPERDQHRLPFYDYTDRIIHQNMISLSVTNLINGKFVSGETPEYRDISRIKLSANFKVAGERRDLLTLVENQLPWSDLIFESDTWLTKQLRLTLDSRYNLYAHNLSTVATGIEFNDQQGNTIGTGYQMARNAVEYFEGKFSTKLIKPLNLSYTARYSFDKRDFLESVYTAEYRHKCWSVNISAHQRSGNQSYSMNFVLAGLGSK